MDRRRLVEGDPAGDMAVAPALAWAKEVRAARRCDLGACTTGELKSFWAAGRRRAPKRWADTKGPIDVVRLTLRRIGWTWPSPWVFKDEKGTGLDVRVATPRLLEWNLRQSQRRCLEHRVSSRMGKRGWQ